ncbi:hypothetical protein LIER_30512 [Lithospermum erythrorhizon]|uniref:Uncharacterized protein n=1 Tax=Lithospermum erythrorhizon TaxID=34254 RepID=A0AAV3RQ49_LITER
MESNSCDGDHLESDVRLPPRKRLLAGLKRQSSPGSTIYNDSLNEFEMRVNHILKNYTSNPDVSNEEIFEISRTAALEAIKFAEVARAAAEEKAAKAVKAMAAAKSALELVATLSEDTDTIDTYLKKIKMNLNSPAQTLYSKQKGTQNCRNDEELARNLHRSMNSSGRVSKNSLTVEKSSHKPNTPSPPSKRPKLCAGGTTTEGKQSPMSNGHGLVGKGTLEVSVQENNMDRAVLSIPKSNDGDKLKMVIQEAPQCDKADNLNVENGESQTVHANKKCLDSPDDTCSKGGNKVKHKQKTLPLSVCNLRDKVNVKEDLKDDLKSGSLPVAGEETTKAIGDGNSPGDCLGSVERTSLLKYQTFETETTAEQNEVSQS